MTHPKLLRLAQAEVQRALNNLPDEVRAAAEECLVSYEEISDEDPDLLGLFEGLNRLDPLPGSIDDLPRIRLFLDNLRDYADGDEQDFRKEVRITYLHELGHYLGWDEAQIEALGL